MDQKRVLILQQGEEFRDIAETDGKYMVSNHGRIWNTVGCFEVTQSVKDRKLVGENGYRIVHLVINGKSVTRPVHRLVAVAFVYNPHPDTWNTVNHIDEDKTNNYAENLEWCDMSYQNNHATHNARVVDSNTRVYRYIPMIIMPDGIHCKSKAAARREMDKLGGQRYMIYDAERLGVRERSIYTIEVTNNSVMRLYTSANVQMALDAFFNAIMSMRDELNKLGYAYSETHNGPNILDYKAIVYKKSLEYGVTLR